MSSSSILYPSFLSIYMWHARRYSHPPFKPAIGSMTNSHQTQGRKGSTERHGSGRRKCSTRGARQDAVRVSEGRLRHILPDSEAENASSHGRRARGKKDQSAIYKRASRTKELTGTGTRQIQPPHQPAIFRRSSRGAKGFDPVQ